MDETRKARMKTELLVMAHSLAYDIVECSGFDQDDIIERHVDDCLSILEQQEANEAADAAPERLPVTPSIVAAKMGKVSSRACLTAGQLGSETIAAIVRDVGDPALWEVKKTPAGTWAVYSPNLPREPMLLTTGQTLADFYICAAMVAACTVAHRTMSGDFDAQEGSAAIRIAGN